MEELRQLEKLQTVLSAMVSHRLVSSSSSDQSSSRFLANLLLLLVQPCGELDFNSKIHLLSDFVPKLCLPFLQEISTSLQRQNGAEPVDENSARVRKNYVEKSVMGKVDRGPLRRHQEDMAMVGLDAMRRANSTLEDFCRSYFMFHGLDINKPQWIFRYLPTLSFTESYIYQMDALNEKIVCASSCRSQAADISHVWIAGELASPFESDPLKPLAYLLESNGFLTERIQEEFKSGKEYWALERKLCHALTNKQKICLEDVMRAIHLKSFDYRVLNLLLYKLRGEKVNDLHMDFLSISEFLVEVSDDLFDYEDDVVENNFNILRMYVRIFGPANAPAELARCISDAEERYEHIMKTLDPSLSSEYKRRCEEATREGGKVSGHSLGTWNIPVVISDEEAYRAELLGTVT